MKNAKINIIKEFSEPNNYTVGFNNFSTLPFLDHLLQLHSNLAIAHSIHRLISLLIAPFILIVGVNVHSIVGAIVALIKRFNVFFNSLIKRCAGYYDAVRDCVPFSEQASQATSSSRKNTDTRYKRKRGSNGSDDDDRNNNNNNKPFSKDIVNSEITFTQISLILRHIRLRVIDIRRTFLPHDYRGDDYGRATTRDNIPIVTIRHIIAYVIEHPNEICPFTSLPLSSILSHEGLRYRGLGYSLHNILRWISNSRGTAHNLSFYTRLNSFAETRCNTYSDRPDFNFNG